MKRLIIGFLIVGLLSGCIESPEKQQPKQMEGFELVSTAYFVDSENGIYVWHDDENKVTCWILETAFSGGLSCIPDSELDDIF